MRIIGGKYRGTRLAGLKGADIRPTLDRVRESLFNQWAPVIEGARFLDLFAGTGAVGLEALSRGAAHSVFVEPETRARDLIQANLERCRIPSSQYSVLALTAQRALPVLEKRAAGFDLVHVDPPFEDNPYASVLEALGRSRLLTSRVSVVAEHPARQVLAENYDKLIFRKSRRLGDTTLSFFGV